MFDTMTLTKVGGALAGSLLVFLLGQWAATEIYSTAVPPDTPQAFLIDTGADDVDDDDDADDDDDGEELDFAALVADADIDAGIKVFAKCKACHKVDGGNATGPHLDGVVDRAKGTIDGFKYSNAMAALSDEVWTIEDLDTFLTSPRNAVPGNKMSFAGLPKIQDRVNLIGYLASLDD